MLLDACLLRNRGGEEAWTEFWTDLIGWAGDKRVKLGPHTAASAAAADLLGLIFTEDADYPPHTKNERIRIVLPLLSRVIDGAVLDAPSGARTEPDHLGEAEQQAALLGDLFTVFSAGLDDVAVGSKSEFWSDLDTPARFVAAGARHEFELINEPHVSLRSEDLARLEEFCRGKRLFIVGAQPEQRILEELNLLFSEVSWLASEAKKSPAVKSKWASLNAQTDVALVVTGSIGHAVSGAAEAAAAKAGMSCLYADRASQILAALRSNCFGVQAN